MNNQNLIIGKSIIITTAISEFCIAKKVHERLKQLHEPNIDLMPLGTLMEIINTSYRDHRENKPSKKLYDLITEVAEELGYYRDTETTFVISKKETFTVIDKYVKNNNTRYLIRSHLDNKTRTISPEDINMLLT